MSRIQLRVYINPGMAEVLIRAKHKDNNYILLTGIVDTGAELCLFPLDLLDILEHRIAGRGKVKVEQAGIAHQTFEATEAFITLFLENSLGNQSKPIEVRGWFAKTEEILIGWDGILDQTTLHIDMRESRSGWLEIDD